jgi:hypothetical protein
MATIDLTGLIQALINGLANLKVATPASQASPAPTAPKAVSGAAGATVTASAFASLPPAIQAQLIAAGVRIVEG